MSFTLELSKENFKFSGTHFTIFDATRAERLHGHNYYVTIQFGLVDIKSETGLAFDFNLVKPIIKDLCEELDEFVLIPQKSPHLNIKKNSDQIDIRFSNKHYLFPVEDVVILPLANITVEELARFFGTSLRDRLRSLPAFPFHLISWLAASIQESHGQRVIYRIEMKQSSNH